jgi:hypothetical protein
VAGYKIYTQKSIALSYTNNEQAEKEVRKIIPLTIHSKTNIPSNKFKEVKYLYNENYEALKKEI